MSNRGGKFDDGRIYVNGCRLSGSLLDLEPFKVVLPESEIMPEKMLSKEYSQNNNNHYKNRRTNSTPSYEGDREPKVKGDNDEVTKLLPPDVNHSATSASCGNLFESPILRIKSNLSDANPANRTNFGGRTASLDFDAHGQDLQSTPITRSTSRDKLIGSDSSPRSQASSESKKPPPIKPNRESLRRSKNDVRSSHPAIQGSSNQSSFPRSGQNGMQRNNGESKPSEHHIPGHHYEELPADVKIVQQRKISQGLADNTPNQFVHEGFKPLAFQSPTTPAVPERPRNPRQRQNPLYAGMHMNPYDARTTSVGTNEKRAPARCLRCIVVGMVFALFFSLLSIAVTALLILGYLQPLEGLGVGSNFKLNASHQLEAANLLLNSQNKTILRLENDLQDLRNRTNRAEIEAQERIQLVKMELVEAVRSLNLSALKGPSTADVSRCIHSSFGIGSSSTQEQIESGEYFTEEGYVTTGVTCSAPPGYVATLHTRQEELEWEESEEEDKPPRIIYNCKCQKLSQPSISPVSGRVACTINYWQCPTL